MFENVTALIIKAVTPVHAGSGRELGFIDMPIQKESHTDIPKIEGSSIKGALREEYKLKNGEKIYDLFGADNGNRAGLIGFSDAKLLFYPIKSIHNLFSYVSCPYLINRFIEDLQMITKDRGEEKNNLQSNNKEGINLGLNNLSKIDPNSIVEGKAIFTDEEKDELILDVFSFTNKKNHEYDELLEFLHNEFKLHRDLVILSDEDFIELISLNREIVTRNRIGDDGITKEGGLFTEEYLPAESILYTLLLVNGIINDTQNLIKKYKSDFPKILQIGGDSTIGKGIVKVKICNPSNGGIKNE